MEKAAEIKCNLNVSPAMQAYYIANMETKMAQQRGGAARPNPGNVNCWQLAKMALIQQKRRCLQWRQVAIGENSDK